MTTPFANKQLLLGVTGSIAAYKALDLASKLAQAGADVHVLMTPSATRFVAPLSFRSVTHRPVTTDLFDPNSPDAIEHIALATQAHALIVAPATAHIIAKLALGLADDPISLTALATSAPLIIAPAMDANMWTAPPVQRNAQTLADRGAVIVGPDPGRLASGISGWGRLADTPQLLGRIAQTLGANSDLAHRVIIVSAGGTQEPIDPVRVITNHSSGKMGYAIAEAARDRGASVILVTAPTALPHPPGVRVIPVQTSEQMRNAIHESAHSADALIMAAAVADYRPANPANHKLKRAESPTLSLNLEPTPDIIASTPPNIIRVAFAAETNNLIPNARAKLRAKNVDLIVANDITLPNSGFGADSNKVWILDPHNGAELPLMPKPQVADAILDRVAALLATRPPRNPPAPPETPTNPTTPTEPNER